jgi:hypothetical protein
METNSLRITRVEGVTERVRLANQRRRKREQEQDSTDLAVPLSSNMGKVLTISSTLLRSAESRKESNRSRSSGRSRDHSSLSDGSWLHYTGKIRV